MDNLIRTGFGIDDPVIVPHKDTLCAGTITKISVTKTKNTLEVTYVVTLVDGNLKVHRYERDIIANGAPADKEEGK